METVILRFSHIPDAAELLDEDSDSSGPRSFLRPRIRQQERLGNTALADLPRAADPGHPAHVLDSNAAGQPFRMHIADRRDMVRGVLPALGHPAAAGGTFNLGATEPVDFGDLLPRMADHRPAHRVGRSSRRWRLFAGLEQADTRYAAGRT